MKSQYGDRNMGTEAEQEMLFKIDKVHAPWPMSHSPPFVDGYEAIMLLGYLAMRPLGY